MSETLHRLTGWNLPGSAPAVMVFTIYLPQFLSKSPLVAPLLAAGENIGDEGGKGGGADGEGGTAHVLRTRRIRTGVMPS